MSHPDNKLDIFWFLPTHGDGRYLGSSLGARAVDHDYLKQVAQAADSLGYGGVLIPTGRACEDASVVAASLIPVTRRLKFLVALRPLADRDAPRAAGVAGAAKRRVAPIGEIVGYAHHPKAAQR